jgi:Ca2+-binding RTX toxin-like protein
MLVEVGRLLRVPDPELDVVPPVDRHEVGRGHAWMVVAAGEISWSQDEKTGGRATMCGAGTGRTVDRGVTSDRKELRMSTQSITRTLFAVLALALALAAGAGTAGAGTLSTNGVKVFYEADPGETDKLVIDATSSEVRIESNVTLTAEPGCVLLNPSATIGRCLLDASEIRLDLKDGNDEVDTIVSSTQGEVPLFVVGGTGQDAIAGGKKDDRLFGNQNEDELVGRAGDDILEGDKGDDVLNGGPGNDFLEGDEGFTAGEDDLTGGLGFDTVQAGPGADVVHAIDGVANEPISCGLGFDTAAIDKFFDALGQLIASDDTSGCEHT